MNNEKILLAASIRHGMFASRDTVEEALEYASATIERLYNDDRAAMYTALHVMLNTIANKITALPDSGNQLPEPPPEVRIDHADLPDTGATSLHDQIEDIVLTQISKLGRAIDEKIKREKALLFEEWFNENVDLEHEIEKHIENNIDFPEIVKEVLLNNLTLTVSVE